MKSLNQYAQEKHVVREDKTGYNYFPKKTRKNCEK